MFGAFHRLVMLRDGTVIGWGDHGDREPEILPPAGLRDVVQIAAVSTGHNLALRSDGKVVGWGDSFWANSAAVLSNIVSICAETLFSAAVRADGSVVQWGHGTYSPPPYNDLEAVFSTSETLIGITQLPVFLEQSKDLVAGLGTSVTLAAEATASSALRYQWYHNGAPVANATNHSLTLTNVQESDQGQYYVEAANAFGRISSRVSSVTSVEVAPELVRASLTSSAVEGSSRNFFVEVSGTEPLAYQWFRDREIIPGATNATLPLVNIGPADEGDYDVSVSNAAGSIYERLGHLRVLYYPRIKNTLTNVNLPAGSAINLQANVTGTGPITNRWVRNGEFLGTGGSLTLQNVQAAQAGEILLMASNEAGVASNAVYMIHVIERGPVIVRQPEDQLFDAGGTAMFRVVAEGTTPLSYQWWKDGQPMAGATNSTFILTSAQPAQVGSYHVVVSNALGGVSSAPARLVQADAATPIDWQSLSLATVASNLPPITHIANAGDGSGRLFLVERMGRIRILEGSNLLTRPFLDISNSVSKGGEDGLFSVAFAPDYRTSGRYYVNYTRRPDSAVVLSRFTVSTDPNVASTNEQVLLAVPAPGPVHNGGQVAFGPDGYLYMGIGDAGVSGNAQDPGTQLGKILRIDVSGSGTNYTVPPSNPFVGMIGFRPEIWAMGLRNPWRSSFDPATGDFYIADVGENDWEEVNVWPVTSRGGENYGWPFFEGNHGRGVGTNITDTSPYTFPTTEYSHSLGRSVTGGLVYRGTEAERMRGMYLFADWGSGRIWGLKQNGARWEREEVARGPQGMTAFGEDEAGNIYVAVSPGANNRIAKLVDERRASSPTFELSSGFPVTSDRVILRSMTMNSFIHYRRDGLEPTEQDPFVRPGESIAVTTNQILTARTFRPDLLPSSVSRRTFDFTVALVLSPPESPVTNGTMLTITSRTPETTIRYTMDGTDVTESSPIYNGPIRLTGNQTVKTRGFKTGWHPSSYYDSYESFYGLLDPEFVAVRALAGTGMSGHVDGPAHQARFAGPAGVFVDPSGNVFVADSGNSAIRKISPSGEVSTISIEAALSTPISVAVDSGGTIVVSDWQARKIFKIAPNGEAVEFGGMNGPRFLEVDAAGNVFVADDRVVKHIRPNGDWSVLGSSLEDFLWYTGVALSGTGEVFASGSTEVFRLRQDGTGELFAGGSKKHTDGPRLEAGFVFDNIASRDLVLDAAGNMYVTGLNFIRKITAEGQVRTLVTRSGSIADWPFQSAYGIALDTKGNIYVADAYGGKIRKIAPDADLDGILDTEEGAGTPFVAGQNDRELDADGDRIDNAAEYIMGTDPQQANEPLEVELATENGQTQLLWKTVVGRTYRLQRSRNLREWEPVGEFVLGTGSAFESKVETSDDAFYRVAVAWN